MRIEGQIEHHIINHKAADQAAVLDELRCVGLCCPKHKSICVARINTV